MQKPRNTTRENANEERSGKPEEAEEHREHDDGKKNAEERRGGERWQEGGTQRGGVKNIYIYIYIYIYIFIFIYIYFYFYFYFYVDHRGETKLEKIVIHSGRKIVN